MNCGNIVLASASPRRKELLKKGEEKSEEKSEEILPEKTAECLARHKAEEVAAKKEHAGKTVIGADTIVTIGGKILGKPKSAAQAKYF